MQFIGRRGAEVLFTLEDTSVIIDESKNLVRSVGATEVLLASFTPEGDQTLPGVVPFELAVAASTDLDIKVFSSNDRLYTVPKSVVTEARRGLAWHAEKNRGGTPVGIATAKTLVAGGQLTMAQIRHIAKYFPRHEADKKDFSYSPTSSEYPSNGRISWALWGGDSAQSWIGNILAKEDINSYRNALTASFNYVMSEMNDPSQTQFEQFIDADVLPIEAAPEFYIRIRLDGSGIDRLYMVNLDGSCFVWDDCMWEDMGNVFNDFETHDRALDDIYDQVEKIHVPVDVDAAVAISGFLSAAPFTPVSIDQINPEEADLIASQMDAEDWGLVDTISGRDTEQDDDLAKLILTASGDYTPEERSRNAGAQVRDSKGLFAKMGSKVVIGGNSKYTGTINSINTKDQTVNVTLENGKQVDVPASITEASDGFTPAPVESVPGADVSKELVNGILGQQKQPVDQPKAKLPDRMAPLPSEKVSTIMQDYSLWAQDQRDKAANPKSSTPVVDKYNFPNAYNDPSLKNFVDGKATANGVTTPYASKSWYIPDVDSTPAPTGLTSAGEPVQEDKPVAKPAPAGTQMTPSTSDIAPIYLAIVSPDDPQAVMDLVALIPASTTSPQPMVFTRKPGKWVPDQDVLNDLNSPTPPPVVVLDNDTLKIVNAQIDSKAVTTASAFYHDHALTALIAGGGIDRNRGNAEKLRRYWLYGEGAAKIRWRTPGDWTRCVNHLSKYLGLRAHGYCALRHKEATGMWTGDARHEQLLTKKGGIKTFSTDVLLPSESVTASVDLLATAAAAVDRVNGTEGQTPEVPSKPATGAKFIIPLVIPEQIESGDGRKFVKGAISIRDLPLPLLWQKTTGDGHSGSVVVGVITHMERTDSGIGNAYGHFDTGEAGAEVERLIRGGFLRGVSADMDMFEASESTDELENGENDSDTKVGGGKMIITKARVMAVTIVPKPAFQQCFIKINDGDPLDEENKVISDGVYVDGVNPLDASALVACGLVAGMIPVTPPKDWFDNPNLSKATPLTVSDDGKVYGHIAAWHVDHIGLSFGTKPPRSRSGYAFFHTGVVRTEEGSDIPVGQLTLAGGHASLEASAQEAARHYDDTGSAVADVHAGEDEFGIWVSGALRPGTTPEQIRALRASAPSGDWRPIKGSLELVAVCQVNVPGFPIARARVASGQVMALVAAGANMLAQLKHDPLAEVAARLDNLEAPIIAAASKAKARVDAVTASIAAQELSNRVKNMMDDQSAYMLQQINEGDDSGALSVISAKVRKTLADQGKAMPDGSFPIRNASDLSNAIHASGRAKPSDKAKVRKHIIKRAKELGKVDILPSAWGTEFTAEELASLVSAGGLDRNRGNAETLRRYWTHGEGAAKIRWGVAGDWSRCVRHLSKFMGVRAKGYCQLRHKDALGIYTATHAKLDHAGAHSNFDTMPMDMDMPIGDQQDQAPTEVTDLDMQKPMTDIHNEQDEHFDPTWDPTPDIVILLESGVADDGDGPDDESDPEDTQEDAQAPLGDDIPKVLPTDTEELFQGQLSITAAVEEAPVDVKPTEAVPDLKPEDTIGLSPQEVEILKQDIATKRAAIEDNAKYTPKTQPRDTSGKFREVLARLKVDLGVSGSQDALKQVAQTENLANTGNYAAAAASAGDLLNTLDRLNSGALDNKSIQNVRETARELGKTIANLPFAFGEQSEKVRFSDVPPALRELMKNMVDRVVQKIGPKDAEVANHDMKEFMSGGLFFSQSDISTQMGKLLRLLT